MTKLTSVLVTLGLVFGALVLSQGCGSSSGSQTPISTLHTGNYIGSGSVWEWALNVGGTFTATKKANSTTPAGSEDLVLTGTYVAHTTGFYTFTVATAASPNGSETSLPSAGATANGFAVPGVVLMVKPAGSDELLVMPVVSTTCPTGTTTFNWVQASPGSYGSSEDLQTKDMWGNASVPAAAGAITGTKWRVDGTIEPSATLTTHTGCSNGIFTLADGFINLLDSGVGLVKVSNSDRSNDILALPRDTSVSLDTLRGKNFVGLVFTSNGGGGEIKPLNITFPASGAGTFTMLTDVSAGTAGETGAVNLVEAGAGEQAGFVKITAEGGGSSTPTMWAAVVSNIASSGRTFFFASGTNVPNGGGPANDPFALIAIQK